MKRYLLSSCFLGAFGLALAGMASAQAPKAPEPSKATPPMAPPETPMDPGPPPLEGPVPYKDPTQPSRRVSDVLGTRATGAAAKLPPISLRGRVIAKDRPPLALLDVEGRMYSITKGSSVPGPNNTVIKVLEVTSSEVRLEVSPLKEVMVLR